MVCRRLLICGHGILTNLASADDIVQQLSPFLNRNAPTDILDICPGTGLLSAKINEALQPRRHVLLETRERHFRDMLSPLTSRPGIILTNIDIPKSGHIDWGALAWNNIAAPEETAKPQTRNDRLLVLANLTDNSLDPAATLLARFIEDGLRRTGLQRYGLVRIVACVPPSEGELVLPRTVTDRGRIGMVVEPVTRHLISIAESDANEELLCRRDDRLVKESASTIARQMTAGGIKVPEGRERPPIPEGLGWTSKRPGESRSNEARRLETYSRRMEFADKQTAVDLLEAQITALTVDLHATPQELSLPQMISLRNQVKQELEEGRVSNYESTVDNRRATRLNSSDLERRGLTKPVLAWDRRPFEPLYIHRGELWPPERELSVLYFEPARKSRIFDALLAPDGQPRQVEISMYLAVLYSLAKRSSDSLADTLRRMFPTKSIQDTIHDVPSLFYHVPKLPLEDLDVRKKSPAQKGVPNVDWFEFFPDEVRLRTLPFGTIHDLIMAYLKSPYAPKSLTQIYRTLGGDLTIADSELIVGSSEPE